MYSLLLLLIVIFTNTLWRKELLAELRLQLVVSPFAKCVFCHFSFWRNYFEKNNPHFWKYLQLTGLTAGLWWGQVCLHGLLLPTRLPRLLFWYQVNMNMNNIHKCQVNITQISYECHKNNHTNTRWISQEYHTNARWISHRYHTSKYLVPMH